MLKTVNHEQIFFRLRITKQLFQKSKVHSEHIELKNYVHIIPKDSFRTHTAVLAALWDEDNVFSEIKFKPILAWAARIMSWKRHFQEPVHSDYICTHFTSILF